MFHGLIFQDDEISNEECLKVGEIIAEPIFGFLKSECHQVSWQEDRRKKLLEQKTECCVAGEEMVVLPSLLHPHLRDGGLRGARPSVLLIFSSSNITHFHIFSSSFSHLLLIFSSWNHSSPFRLLKFIFCREVRVENTMERVWWITMIVHEACIL